MDIPLFIGMMFGLQFFYWAVARRYSKNLKGNNDYFLAGKGVQFFPLMMTFLATQVGGGVVLGSAEEAFEYGWPAIFYPLGAATGLIILGLGIGKRISEFKVSTVAQIFEVSYRSSFLKKVASILSIVSLFMILTSQIIASSKFLVSLGFDNTWLFIAFWAIVIMYTVQGGLRAVISTDLVQAAFFSLIFLLCFGYIFFVEPSARFIEMPRMEMFSDLSPKLTAWLLMPLLFMIIEQDMGQRCFAGKSSKIVSKAAFFAGIATLVICVIPVFFGTLAKTMNLQVKEGSSVLMEFVSQTTNPWIAAVVGCAILAAVVSTATSLINAISSNLANDFTNSLISKKMSTKKIKVLTLFMSISSIFFAFWFDNIVDMLIESYELSVSCLFASIFIALFKKNGRTLSAALSISLGAFSFFVFRFYPISFPKEVVSILLSFLGFWAGELFLYLRRKAQVMSLE